MSFSDIITSTLFVASSLALAFAYATSQPARYRLRTICRTECTISLVSFGFLAVWMLTSQHPVVSLIPVLVMGISNLIIAALAAAIDHSRLKQGNPA